MPRLLKYSNILGNNNPFEEIPDDYLRAVEYGGFSYLIDGYANKSKIQKAIALSLSIALYEYALKNYYPEKATKLPNSKAIEGKDQYPIV